MDGKIVMHLNFLGNTNLIEMPCCFLGKPRIPHLEKDEWGRLGGHCFWGPLHQSSLTRLPLALLWLFLTAWHGLSLISAPKPTPLPWQKLLSCSFFLAVFSDVSHMGTRQSQNSPSMFTFPPRFLDNPRLFFAARKKTNGEDSGDGDLAHN